MNTVTPDDCESACECCLNVSNVIAKIGIRNLFSKRILNQPTRVLGSSLSDASYIEGPLYAVTVNIQPTKKMNNRQWRLYTPEKQTAQLMRIEKSFRDKNPSCKLVEIHFETCPTLRNMHFHALYQMSDEIKDHYVLHFNRICGSTGEQTDPWRHLDCEPVRSKEAWIAYIRKDRHKK